MGSEQVEALEFRNVTVRYGTRNPFTAVENLSLSVAQGEVVAVLGTSGCGKSTMINVAAGFLKASVGDVFREQVPVKGPSPRCGVVFQTDAVFPWMRVRQNLAFGINEDLGDSTERIRQALASVGLQGEESKWPRELSGGMRKRVEIARALITEPSALLLDEPFGSLDALTRERLQVLLLDVVRTKGMAALLVTHDVEEALFLANRVAVMSQSPGRITHVVDVPFEYPRRISLKGVLEFVTLRQSLRDSLGESR